MLRIGQKINQKDFATEFGHVKSGHSDIDQGFELTLSDFLGNISVKALQMK
jgi:hypothetical protein